MTEASVSAAPSLESLVAQVADEFRERQKQGEQPDIEEYAARYPEAAPLLRKVLASLQLIGLSLSGGAGAPAGDDVPDALGDFRIVREVGRGGMGVVYEAEQRSLKRRVALKVLPFAAVMDPRQLQRFQIEAQAAAGLHHTNIVPVFFVGCERGVVHRDVKPANLLLDGEGTLWATDFGLAQVQSDMRLTMSGDLVGTLLMRELVGKAATKPRP